MTSVVISSLLTLHLKHSVWLSPVKGDLSPLSILTLIPCIPGIPNGPLSPCRPGKPYKVKQLSHGQNCLCFLIKLIKHQVNCLVMNANWLKSYMIFCLIGNKNPKHKRIHVIGAKTLQQPNN